MAALSFPLCSLQSAAGARKQCRPAFIRRVSTARFVMPPRATAPDAEHQEPERSSRVQHESPQTERTDNGKAPDADTNRRRRDEPQQDLAAQIEARGIACARELLLIQSVEDVDTEGVFGAVDADGNAFIDLRELANALSKWMLIVASPDAPLAAAKNLALDLYLIFGVDPLQGFDRWQFKRVLQSWCLFIKISFDVLARIMEIVLQLPVAQLSPEDKTAAEELDQAMSSPEAMAAAVNAHKIDLVFHLWDTDADGVASRKKLTRALTWYYRLLSQVQEESKPGEGGGRRPEVIDFLECEQRPGLPGLDRGAFRALVQRFCQLTGVSVADVCEFLMTSALEGGAVRLDAMGETAPNAPQEPADIQDIINGMQPGDQPGPEEAQQESHPPDHAQQGVNLPNQAQHAGESPDQAEREGNPSDQAQHDQNSPDEAPASAAGHTEEGESRGKAELGAGQSSPPG